MVQQRHRSLMHIGNALTPEGCMWMNCIKVNRQDIE
jgi:hypothetical protein